MNYYIDILPGDISKNSPYMFDNDGVIMTKIPYTNNYRYHTTAIASYAILNAAEAKKFDAQVKWLTDNISNSGAFINNFSLPYYTNFPHTWIGGLSQGLAISVFLMAGKENLAKRTFDCLLDMCVDIDEENNLWIEEYPLDPSPRILNGFIYALFGVYDLYKKTDNEDALDTWVSGLITIEENIRKYDLGSWSRYNLLEGMPATPFYNNIHIKQMRALYVLTKRNFYIDYANKWNKYTAQHKMLRMKKIINKNGIFGTVKKYRQRKRWLSG